MRSRHAFAAAILVALSACGGRTPLREQHAGGGGAGEGATTASSSTGGASTSSATASTGAGGAACGAPVISGILNLDGVPTDQRDPALVALDDGRVVVAYKFSGAVDPYTPRLMSVTLDWMFPPPSIFVEQVFEDAGLTYAASLGTTAELAFVGERTASPGLVYVETAADPTTPFSEPVTDEAHHVQFLARGGLHLLGAETTGAPRVLHTWLAKPVVEGTFFQGPIPLGCASTSIAADAVAVDDGTGSAFVVAFANGVELGGGAGCSMPGPATQLQIARVGAAGDVTMGASIGQALLPGAEAYAIPRVRVAPRAAGGAWVLWFGATLFGEDTPPPGLLLTQIGPDLSDGGTAPIANTQPGGAFGITRVGDGLLLAWSESSPDGGQRIVVRQMDTSFGRVFEQSFAVPGALDPELSLAVSPDADAALVAWSARTGDGKSPHAAYVAKVCLPAR